MSDDVRVHATYYVALIQAFVEVAKILVSIEMHDLTRVEFSSGVTLERRLRGLIERARELGINTDDPL